MDAAFIDEYEEFDMRHWWHVVRRQIIHGALDRYAPAEGRWLDAGCGPGVLLASYERIGTENKIGLEIDAGNVRRARTKGLDVRPANESWDLSDLGAFDLITACDVLEHLESDDAAVGAVHGALRPGGVFLATVPALKSLWSNHDRVSHHFRRYDRRTLAALFPEDQWEILRLTYFSSVLLPVIWGVRKVKNLCVRIGGGEGSPHHDVSFGPAWRDRVLQGLFGLERAWLKRGRDFPIGSSLMLVARRRS